MAKIFYFNLCIDIFPFFKITGETWTLMNLFQRQSLRVKWSLDELFYILFSAYVLVKYPSLCSSRFWIKYIKCLNTVDIFPCSFPEVLSLKNFSWICSPCVVRYFPVVEMHGRSFYWSVEELTVFDFCSFVPTSFNGENDLWGWKCSPFDCPCRLFVWILIHVDWTRKKSCDDHGVL